MKYSVHPTQNRLRAVFDYDKGTGIFRWKGTPDRRPQWTARYVGTIAGRVNIHGRLQIMVDGVRYEAHRLAWIYENGVMPIANIDHINGNPLDNRIANLREVTQVENCQNSSGKSRCGLPKGVTKSGKRFRALIRVYGKNIELGTFPTPEDAHQAYASAALKHFGEFARLS